MKRDSVAASMSLPTNPLFRINLLIVAALCCTWLAGCSSRRASGPRFAEIDCGPCQSMLQQVSIPDLANDCCDSEPQPYSVVPLTISNFQEQVPLELTVEDCVEYALANSRVLQKLGGVVVNSPGTTRTLYDQALTETSVGAFGGGASVESALSAFDANVVSSLYFNHNERRFNNPLFGGGASSQVSDLASYRFEINKVSAAGTQFAVRNLTDYTSNNNPIATPASPFGNRFRSVYDTVNQVEVRQPLLRGAGTAVNRIAGPNAISGVYNGVLIARIRSDISLTDFEIAVRNLVRDVESNYWELFFAYQDLDTKIAARESSRATWENRKLRYENGVGRPDEEAQARQQYFDFQAQAQNALTGLINGQPGVLGAERSLRRLMGFTSADGRLIKPISEPAIAPIAFDWDQTQQQALERRSELRRQKWVVKQRELEMLAARSLNKWRFDMVGQYDWRGFGDDLFGQVGVPQGSATQDLLNGDLNDWQVGFELGGAIGQRQGHLAVRNAELNLVREKALLKEQERQIIHDLNAAYTEVDRAMQNLRTSFNSRIAVQEELDPKRKRVTEGQDQVFFLLDAEQRAAAAESNVHRAVADYNLALLNYTFIAGSMLSRYNVSLTEGPWSADAQQNAVDKANRYQPGRLPTTIDVAPVTTGSFNQTNQIPAATVAQIPPVAAPEKSAEEESTLKPDLNSNPKQRTAPEPDINTDALDKLLPSKKSSQTITGGNPISSAKSYFQRRR